jgi:hypothetical protein
MSVPITAHSSIIIMIGAALREWSNDAVSQRIEPRPLAAEAPGSEAAKQQGEQQHDEK